MESLLKKVPGTDKEKQTDKHETAKYGHKFFVHCHGSISLGF